MEILKTKAKRVHFPEEADIIADVEVVRRV
jgi:hypothetical protein